MTDDINDISHTSTYAKAEAAIRKDERSRYAAATTPEPAAWLVKWVMKNSGPQASAYLKEEDARHAAKNVEAYSHATGVEVMPVYAAQKTIERLV